LALDFLGDYHRHLPCNLLDLHLWHWLDALDVLDLRNFNYALHRLNLGHCHTPFDILDHCLHLLLDDWLCVLLDDWLCVLLDDWLCGGDGTIVGTSIRWHTIAATHWKSAAKSGCAVHC
jgi:hypothetical protein